MRGSRLDGLGRGHGLAAGDAAEVEPDDQRRQAIGEEDESPAEEVGDRGAEAGAEDLAEGDGGEVAAEGGLALAVGDGVADVGQGERDQGGGGDAGQEAQQDQERETRRGGADGGADCEEQDRDGHDPQLADAVAERSVDELEEAVGQGVGGDRQPGGGDAGVEGVGDDRQERVDDAGVGDDQETERAEDADGDRGGDCLVSGGVGGAGVNHG